MSAGEATGCEEFAPLYIWKQTDERRTGLVVEQALWTEHLRMEPCLSTRYPKVKGVDNANKDPTYPCLCPENGHWSLWTGNVSSLQQVVPGWWKKRKEHWPQLSPRGSLHAAGRTPPPCKCFLAVNRNFVVELHLQRSEFGFAKWVITSCWRLILVKGWSSFWRNAWEACFTSVVIINYQHSASHADLLLGWGSEVYPNATTQFCSCSVPGISCQIKEVSSRMTQICENNPDFTGVNKAGWQILSRSVSASKGWCSAPTSAVERSCWGQGVGIGFFGLVFVARWTALPVLSSSRTGSAQGRHAFPTRVEQPSFHRVLMRVFFQPHLLQAALT